MSTVKEWNGRIKDFGDLCTDDANQEFEAKVHATKWSGNFSGSLYIELEQGSADGAMLMQAAACGLSRESESAVVRLECPGTMWRDITSYTSRRHSGHGCGPAYFASCFLSSN